MSARVCLRRANGEVQRFEATPGLGLVDALGTGGEVLFGCRTGICGTCLVTVHAAGALERPDAAEQETLDLLAPGNPRARLACCLKAAGELTLEPLEPQ